MENAVKREIKTEAKKTLSISDLILIAVLLAAGAVLKFFVGSLVNIGGMKPNFIIAMYCLAILLIKPRIRESVIIGILAGAICQLLPGSPYINLASETIGAVIMALTMLLPLTFGKFNARPLVCTLIATIASGSVFVVCLFLFMGAEASSMVAYIPIVFFTAVINAVIVQILYIPLKAALKK